MHLRGKGAQVTDQQQRIAIAEACGWTLKKGIRAWNRPNNNGWDCLEQLPDYTNDLNAMQSAVISQNYDFQQEFHNALMSLAGFPHQAKSTQWAEIFVDIALRKGIITT
jgi:hypothetical protein